MREKDIKTFLISMHSIAILGIALMMGFVFFGCLSQSSLPQNQPEQYTTAFKGLERLEAAGITSTTNSLRIHTADVAPGGQCIEAYGTISSSQWLSVRFNIRKLASEDRIDLSDKVLSVNMFFPADTPISNVNFTIFSRKPDGFNQPISLSYRPVRRGQWNTYEIDVSNIGDFELWPFSNPTSAEARSLVSRTEEIDLGCNAGGNAVAAYFLVDKPSWNPSAAGAIAYDPAVDSLRKLAEKRGLIVGCGAELAGMSDTQYPRLLLQEFDLVMNPENAWVFIQPDENTFDYGLYDSRMKFGIDHGLKIKAYTGIWHETWAHPKWLVNKPYRELEAAMNAYLENLLGRYKGKVFIWDVCNEIIMDDGVHFRNNDEPPGYQYSIWADSRNDSSLIKKAYRKARQVDPEAKLYLNDFAIHEIGRKKSESFYNFVREMQNEGVPIDGVGFELHMLIESDGTVYEWDPNVPVDFGKIDATIERYKAIGIQVEFSEVDVRFYSGDIDTSTRAGQTLLEKRLAQQADVYRKLMQIALRHDNVSDFITFSLTDRYSWTDADAKFKDCGNLFIYDRDYHPRPAYYALLDELKGK